MGTVVQDRPHINLGSQPRWDRFARADLFAHYRQLRTEGVSERQAAQDLPVPRTTLQAWRLWHDTLAICPHVAAFFQSGPDWRSSTDSSLLSLWSAWKSGPAVCASFVCSCI